LFHTTAQVAAAKQPLAEQIAELSWSLIRSAWQVVRPLRGLGCAATGERGEGYFGDVGVVTGTVLDQPFEGKLPVPGPVPQEKVGELQVVLTPLGTTVTGPGHLTRPEAQDT
jgi:hypothetical protein